MQAVNVCTPNLFDLYDSYGLIACQLARQLAGAGLYVNAYALQGIERGVQPEDVRAILAQPRVPVLGGIFLGYPVHYWQHGAMAAIGPHVALTMFESSRIPAGWAEALNRCESVVTPSRFCRDVFRECGVTAPIHVVPLGLSPVYKPRQELGIRDKGLNSRRSEDLIPNPYSLLPERPLTFLAFLDRGKRKGGLLALNAFVRAFGEREDVHLILKAREAQSIGKPALQVLNPNVTVVAQDMTEEELYALYLSCDVLISPATGEGFGLIPREFAATGGVALATHWSGTAEEIDLWGVPLPYRLVKADWREARNLAGQELGEWAEVDRDALVDTLRDVAANHDRYAERAQHNAEYVRWLYSWDKFGEQMMDLWSKVANGYRDRAVAA